MWFFPGNAAMPEMKQCMATLFSHRRRMVFWIVPCVLVLMGWFWWSCLKNPETHFLPSRGPAEWIVYPNAPDVSPYRIAESSAEFRRDFIVKTALANCSLRVCAFRSFDVKLNGKTLPIPAIRPLNWKDP